MDNKYFVFISSKDFFRMVVILKRIAIRSNRQTSERDLKNRRDWKEKEKEKERER